MKARQMQVISTKTHGILDYLTVGFALAFPRMLRCSSGFTNAVTMIALGKLGYAMMTKHELGVAKVIPMKAHLTMDAVGGATLAALPFLMDEENPAAIACAVGMGLFDIAAAPITSTDDVECPPSEQAMYSDEDDSMARQWRVGARAQQSGMNVPAVTGL